MSNFSIHPSSKDCVGALPHDGRSELHHFINLPEIEFSYRVRFEAEGAVVNVRFSDGPIILDRVSAIC